MTGEKWLAVGLIVLNIALLTLCGFFYLKKDRGEPKLSFSASDVVYSADMDQTLLLQGVEANDNADGNISDRIVVEKILENRDENTAVVYYAVCDYSGNVSKASRVFPAEYKATEETEKSEGEETAEVTEAVLKEEKKEDDKITETVIKEDEKKDDKITEDAIKEDEKKDDKVAEAKSEEKDTDDKKKDETKTKKNSKKK